MNKFLLYSAFAFLLSMTVPVQAQEESSQAAAEAPAEAPAAAPAAPAEAPAPAPAPVVSAPVISAPSIINESPLTKGLRDGLPLRVRQEQGFDANGNNFLEPAEIKAFLKNVYQATASGPVKNTSDILYGFDKNKDGYIDRSEASGFSQYSF